MIIPLLDKIAHSSTLLTIVLLVELACIYYQQELTKSMEPYGGIIDARFAFSPEEMMEWVDQLGEQGRLAYQKVASFDLFPFMESYALLLGALLLQQTRAAGFQDTVAMIFPLAMVFDVLETAIAAWACRTHPRILNQHFLTMASAANKYKWVLIMAGLFTTSILFVYNSLLPKKKENTKEE